MAEAGSGAAGLGDDQRPGAGGGALEVVGEELAGSVQAGFDDKSRREAGELGCVRRAVSQRRDGVAGRVDERIVLAEPGLESERRGEGLKQLAR